MARQKGIIKLEGRIGDLSFYKNGGDYLARSKGGVDGDRIKNDPAFARTRENGSEFGRAGKASKLLRSALKAPISVASDKQVASRLTTALLKVIQADTTNARGERTVVAGDLNLLKGFEFNNEAGLEEIVKAPYTVGYDRATGEVAIAIEFTNPSLELNQVEGATQARFTAGIASVDFENKEFDVDVLQSDAVDLSSVAAATINVAPGISANSALPVIIVLGVEYYQTVNGQLYLINNKESRALSVINVDLP
ncbi:MAG: hypothetical protein JW717_10725 [Marinilabiliaceae bacterium]|nr:hypothetical protein [Marinilabiliaceae bacterium]